MKDKKTITPDERLKAIALFHMAREHAAEVVRFEAALNKLLGLEMGSHVSDHVYNTNPVSVAEFDELLSLEDITVEGSEGDEDRS